MFTADPAEHYDQKAVKFGSHSPASAVIQGILQDRCETSPMDLAKSTESGAAQRKYNETHSSSCMIIALASSVLTSSPSKR